jgi:hypothetical protein
MGKAQERELPASSEELPADVSIRLARIDALARVASQLPMPLGLVAVFYFLWKIAESIAGKITVFTAQTSVDVTAELPGALPVSWQNLLLILLSTLLVIALLIILFQQVMLRVQRQHTAETIRHLAGKSEAYEKLIDPDRSSSGLTREGRTHPRDE